MNYLSAFLTPKKVIKVLTRSPKACLVKIWIFSFFVAPSIRPVLPGRGPHGHWGSGGWCEGRLTGGCRLCCNQVSSSWVQVYTTAPQYEGWAGLWVGECHEKCEGGRYCAANQISKAYHWEASLEVWAFEINTRLILIHSSFLMLEENLN